MFFNLDSKKSIIKNGLSLVFFTFLTFSIVGGCGGADPEFAPFGSTVEMLNPPGDITIPANSIEPFRVQAIVLDPEGLPINGVRVRWDLFVAGTNSIVVDTNGDSVPDSKALQFANPQACGSMDCLLVPISQWFGLGAFVDSPFETLTDDRGIADIIILISGNIAVDPATLEASTESGSVDSQEFTVNADNIDQ